MARVTFIGLGHMGSPMAARLVAAGHEVTVWNRTHRPEAVPDRAVVADTPRAAAAAAEIVITMVSDGAALRTVLCGEHGLLAGAAPGTVLVDMSTIGPVAAREVAALCADASVGFLDAPVSGSVAAATAGTLVAMVGGDAETLRVAWPILAAITANHFHLGAVGNGAAMKLAVNLMLAVTNETIAETIALTDRAGIDSELAYDVLAASAVGSPFVGYKRDAFLRPDETPVAFAVELMRKDAALALDLAARLESRTPAGSVAAEVLDEAITQGLGASDISAVRQLLSG